MDSSTRRALIGFAVLVALAVGAVVGSRPDHGRPESSAQLRSSPTVPPAFEAATTSTGPPRIIDNRLFLLGDSVLQGAAPRLADELADWSVTSDTRVGRFTDEAIGVARRRRRQIGDVVIVGLGNNYGGDRAALEEQVAELLATLETADHILWLTVAEFRPDRREVNAVLRAAARRDPRVELVDWVPMWRRHPSYTSSDRLHLTAEGAAAMARLVVGRLVEVLRASNEVPSPDPSPPKLDEKGSIPTDPPRSSRTSQTSTTLGVSPDASTTQPADESTTTEVPEGPTTTDAAPSSIPVTTIADTTTAPRIGPAATGASNGPG